MGTAGPSFSNCCRHPVALKAFLSPGQAQMIVIIKAQNTTFLPRQRYKHCNTHTICALDSCRKLPLPDLQYICASVPPSENMTPTNSYIIGEWLIPNAINLRQYGGHIMEIDTPLPSTVKVSPRGKREIDSRNGEKRR